MDKLGNNLSNYPLILLRTNEQKPENIEEGFSAHVWKQASVLSKVEKLENMLGLHCLEK